MNPRNQVEIKIHKNDYLTISFIGDINFAGRWYGTPETLREKLRSFPHKSERDTVLERLHIWFENYCEGNEDPDLWVAFLHAERTLRQAGEP
jgi:hypothetical protein